MTYLLDTCIVSEYLKKQPAPKVLSWLEQQDELTLYLSCLTIAELRKGYYKLHNRKPASEHRSRAKQISSWIQRLKERFGDRTLTLDPTILEGWASLCGKSEAEGRNLPVIDSLIAATASCHGMVIVTRNVTDFENCSEDLEIFNPY
ncbi:MAG: type II toxin-antitoxin system VapC family toxin [Phormidesmis sp.]